MECCQYPKCRKDGDSSWAMIPICETHRDLIRAETLAYYKRSIPYYHRLHYLRIARLISWTRCPKYAGKDNLE